MRAIVSPSNVTGTVTAPASKSAMQRACAAALIHHGTTTLRNPGISADDLAALGIIQQLGASTKKEQDSILIESKGIRPISDAIHSGESGLSVRMFTAIAAVSNKAIEITGAGSLVKRPLSFFDEVLPKLGVAAESNGGFLPLKIRGPLQPKDITIDGSLSSQFLTGLLFAFAAAQAAGVTIYVKNLNSRPYVDLTLEVMRQFGFAVPVNKDYKEFHFNDTPTPSSPNNHIQYTVEGDWSGGAFLLVGAAIAGNATIKGLNQLSTQADKAILQILSLAGTQMFYAHDAITVKNSPLKAFSFNATDCPDLFPPIVALAANCEGTTTIEGVSRLTHKESNRSLTLQEEFGKMGVQIRLDGNYMHIEGNGKIKGANTHAHHDHRIAMACGIAGLRADQTMIIDSADAVNKSYPNFWQHLQELGARVSLQEN